MSGQHLKDLLHRTQGMRWGHVDSAKTTWGQTATALEKIETALNNASTAILLGFGEGDTGPTSAAAFTAAAKRVGERRVQMATASVALDRAAAAMHSAQKVADDAPDAPPAQAPTPPTATGDPVADIHQAKEYNAIKNAYNSQVATYGDADETARKKVERLLAKYAEAMVALQAIQADPTDDRKKHDTDDRDTTRTRVPYFSTHQGDGLDSVGNDDDDSNPDDDNNDTGNDDNPGDDNDTGPHDSVVDPFPGDGSATGNLPISSGPGGGGLSGGALAGGAATAGLFGAPSVIRGLRGLAGSRGLSSGSGTIGSTSRSTGAGSLGRSGGGIPGSPVNRAGGRGAAGGAGGAGGRGKKRDKRQGNDRDLYDDGQDWLDDEGSAPGVLD